MRTFTALVLLSSAAAFAADPHDTLSVLELKIGMPMEQPGFACTKNPGPYNGAECVKFLDPRCKAPGKIGERGYGSTPPKGCFLEERTVSTFLNGQLMQQRMEVGQGTEKPDPARNPLINVHTYGTKTKPSKISRIVYTMAMDELASGDQASGSKLYKALVAKYGEPKEIWSGKVKWRAGSTTLEAYCDLNLCSLEIEDKAFEQTENAEQEEADTKARQQEAPEPKL